MSRQERMTGGFFISRFMARRQWRLEDGRKNQRFPLILFPVLRLTIGIGGAFGLGRRVEAVAQPSRHRSMRWDSPHSTEKL